MDLDVHLNREDLAAYVRHGVTSVRNMWGFPDLWVIKQEIDAGETLGPTIYTVSPGLDGTPGTWPLTQFVTDRADADSVVAVQASAGYATLKIYQNLTVEAYEAIVGERGLAAWARIDQSQLEAVVEMVRRSGTAIVPTEAVIRNTQKALPPATREAGFANRHRVIQALHEAGVAILPGTDAGIGVTALGTSLLQELEFLREAGLSRECLLRAATAKAAAFLGAQDEFGTIVPGMRADLLLLNENPLNDLEALADPEEVIVRGLRLDAPLLREDSKAQSRS